MRPSTFPPPESPHRGCLGLVVRRIPLRPLISAVTLMRGREKQKEMKRGKTFPKNNYIFSACLKRKIEVDKKKLGRVATFAKYFYVFLLEPLWRAKKSLTNKRHLANKRLIAGNSHFVTLRRQTAPSRHTARLSMMCRHTTRLSLTCRQTAPSRHTARLSMMYRRTAPSRHTTRLH